MDLAAYMIAFTALCLITAIHIRIRDLEDKGEHDGGKGNVNGNQKSPV